MKIGTAPPGQEKAPNRGFWAIRDIPTAFWLILAALATIVHARGVQRTYPHAEITLSCPRLRPTVADAGMNPRDVGERELLQEQRRLREPQLQALQRWGRQQVPRERAEREPCCRCWQDARTCCCPCAWPEPAKAQTAMQ